MEDVEAAWRAFRRTPRDEGERAEVARLIVHAPSGIRAGGYSLRRVAWAGALLLAGAGLVAVGVEALPLRRETSDSRADAPPSGSARGAIGAFGLPDVGLRLQNGWNNVVARIKPAAAAEVQPAPQPEIVPPAASSAASYGVAGPAHVAAPWESWGSSASPQSPDFPKVSPAQVAAVKFSPTELMGPELFDCDVGYHRSNWAVGWSVNQTAWCCQKHQRGCPGPRRLTFWMYRAQDDHDYPMENVNMADLPGLMWYLHNEVVVSTPRKYNVTRIIRFKVTTMTNQAQYNREGAQFGPFTAFDGSLCTVPGCQRILDEAGNTVGCQSTDSSKGLGNYVSLASMPCEPPACLEGQWYSLPGACPLRNFSAKGEILYETGQMCNLTYPGGSCKTLADDLPIDAEAPVTGEPGCTYYTHWAGEIRMDQLSGITDYNAFWQSNQKEYDVAYDTGICTDCYPDFWAGRNNQTACGERQLRVLGLFADQFPHMSAMPVGETPPCLVG